MIHCADPRCERLHWQRRCNLFAPHAPPQNSLNYQTKKSDVQSALQERDIDFVENVYNKAMRTLCVSRGGTWTLKTGADL